MIKPPKIILKLNEIIALENMLNSSDATEIDRLHIAIVLLAARGKTTIQITEELDISLAVAQKWRLRFAKLRVSGLIGRKFLMLIAQLPDPKKKLLLSLGFPSDKAIINLNGYPAIHIQNKLTYVHLVVADHILNLRPERYKTEIHHKDEDRWNFLPSNLELLTVKQHRNRHKRFGKNNPFFGHRHTDETKLKIAEIARAYANTWDRADDGTFKAGGFNARAFV